MELVVIASICLIILIIMFISYKYIVITNPNYPATTQDIILIYVTNYNSCAQLLFSNVKNFCAGLPTNVDTTYFKTVDTTNIVLSMSNYSNIFSFVDIYLSTLESAIAACISNSISIQSVLNSYNEFMIFVLGYDVRNGTTYDVNNIYGLSTVLAPQQLITPFGKLCRKVPKNDPNVAILSDAFDTKYCCYNF